MILGLISDTHIPERANELPKKVLEIFKEVDLILHSGDITDQSVLDKLNEIAPVKAVQGNMDRAYGLDLPKNIVLEIENKKVGVIHGQVYPRGDTQQLYYTAKELEVDILVSGHSHQPQIEQIKNVLLLNPGSPTVPRLADRTVMLLEITSKEVNVDLIKIGSPVCSALDFNKFK
ncbi:MAG: YfcE family phosphodiesterase [archaeon]|nr:YfcE family phosphodiesterase [archaeon]